MSVGVRAQQPELIRTRAADFGVQHVSAAKKLCFGRAGHQARHRYPGFFKLYGIIAAATIIGFGLGFTSINPIKMLVWSAVINGIAALPIVAVMMLIISMDALMGRFKAKPWLVRPGWGGTALMAVAVVSLLWSSLS